MYAYKRFGSDVLRVVNETQMKKNLAAMLVVPVLILGMAATSHAQNPFAPVSVPDATATIILLGAAVIGLGLVARKLT
jgi:hypothetical protein